jgi:Bacterial SH3 domain
MHHNHMKTLLVSLSLLIAVGIHAKEPSPVVDRYKTDLLGANFFSAPDPNSQKIGQIPPGITFTPLAKQSYWIKVRHGSNIGWISTASCERLMAAPSADLDIVFRGYRMVGSKYHYYFRATNRGVQSYVGNFTVHLYAHDEELLLRGVGFPVRGPDGFLRDIDSTEWSAPHIYTPDEVSPRGYPLDPDDVIKPTHIRNYYLIADGLATRYVFETVQGKKEGPITNLPNQ